MALFRAIISSGFRTLRERICIPLWKSQQPFSKLNDKTQEESVSGIKSLKRLVKKKRDIDDFDQN